MRQKEANQDVSVNAIAGTHVVMLGLDATEAARKGPLGFTILRREGNGKNFAPSFRAFKTALTEARLFCIVTARGHSAETIRKGVEVFISEALSDDERAEMLLNIQRFHQLARLKVPDDRCLSSYLQHNGYVGVSSPGFLKIFESESPDDLDTGASPEGARPSRCANS